MLQQVGLALPEPYGTYTRMRRYTDTHTHTFKGMYTKTTCTHKHTHCQTKREHTHTHTNFHWTSNTVSNPLEDWTGSNGIFTCLLIVGNDWLQWCHPRLHKNSIFWKISKKQWTHWKSNSQTMSHLTSPQIFISTSSSSWKRSGREWTVFFHADAFVNESIWWCDPRERLCLIAFETWYVIISHRAPLIGIYFVFVMPWNVYVGTLQECKEHIQLSLIFIFYLMICFLIRTQPEQLLLSPSLLNWLGFWFQRPRSFD